MEEKLISKKDLLELTGISYGQLYRWKRKNIIPEEWFIKKSVSTGQETFFPMDKILTRVKEILALKDESSLDELADKFSNNIKKGEVLRNYIVERNIVSLFVLEKFEEIRETKDRYDSDELVLLLVFDCLVNSAVINLEETIDIVKAIEDGFSNIKEEKLILILKRKLGVLFYYVIDKDDEIIKDEMAKEILKVDFNIIKNTVNEIL